MMHKATATTGFRVFTPQRMTEAEAMERVLDLQAREHLRPLAGFNFDHQVPDDSTLYRGDDFNEFRRDWQRMMARENS